MPIDVKNPKNSCENFLRSPIGHNVINNLGNNNKFRNYWSYIKDYQEFNKVNCFIIVEIIKPKHVFLHFLGIFVRQSLKRWNRNWLKITVAVDVDVNAGSLSASFL